MKNPIFTLTILFAALILMAAKPEKKEYSEKYRPQFHFSAKSNWMSNPSGLVFYDGEYHLFFQHNPSGNKWGHMHWGHAVSHDLVHWKQLPVAIFPDKDSTDTTHCAAWSGCAVVDTENRTGLQSGANKTLLAFYTSYKCGQRMAYSNDKGRTWKKYSENPLIPFVENEDAHDPNIFWHEPSQTWVMTLYRKPNGNTAEKGISFYSSTNLIDWKFQSHLPGFFECPNLLELSYDSNEDEKQWALLGGNGAYVFGDFDGKTFSPKTGKIKLDYGKNFYATQTWKNHPEGKVIQLAWMRGGQYPEMPFTGQMSFPSELKIRETPSGPIIVRNPIEKISSLHGKKLIKKNKNLMPGLNNNFLSAINGQTIHIVADISIKSADAFGFMVAHSRKNNGVEIRYDVKNKTLYCLGTKAFVEPIDDQLHFEILVDRTSVELFVNHGEVSLSTCFLPEEKSENLVLWTQGGEIFIQNMEVYKLQSAWRTE